MLFLVRRVCRGSVKPCNPDALGLPIEPNYAHVNWISWVMVFGLCPNLVVDEMLGFRLSVLCIDTMDNDRVPGYDLVNSV